jgi:6-phosphogluconolactonase
MNGDTGIGMSSATPSGGESRILVRSNPHDLARMAARMVVESLAGAVVRRGSAHVVLSGGSTPAALYRVLASEVCRSHVDWRCVHLWLGDERWVAPDHHDSNGRMVRQTLLAVGGAASGATLHEVDTRAGDPATGARRYEGEVRHVVPIDAQGTPVFDVLLAGVGTDGHTLSLFPGSPWLSTSPPDARAACVAVPMPTHVTPHVPRVTLTPVVLCAARAVLVVVSGSSKADIVAEVLGAPAPDPVARPSVILRRPGATWLLDREAASGL